MFHNEYILSAKLKKLPFLLYLNGFLFILNLHTINVFLINFISQIINILDFTYLFVYKRTVGIEEKKNSKSLNINELNIYLYIVSIFLFPWSVTLFPVYLRFPLISNLHFIYILSNIHYFLSSLPIPYVYTVTLFSCGFTN